MPGAAPTDSAIDILNERARVSVSASGRALCEQLSLEVAKPSSLEHSHVHCRTWPAKSEHVAVNGAHYLNEFLARHLDGVNARLDGSFTQQPGKGKTTHHTLVIGERRLPSYFCSSSPSDRRNPGMLRARIEREQHLLLKYMSANAQGPQ
jgi:hypothetical protein